MNKPLIEKRYQYLICLRNNGGRMTAAALAETMNKSVQTVWATFGLLQNEYLLERGKNKSGAYIIQVTPAGFAWKEPPKREPKLDAPKHPCGCPIVESTPGFCLKHRNLGRWDAWDGNSRYYMPTMKQVMER
jgi:hypothetical protein